MIQKHCIKFLRNFQRYYLDNLCSAGNHKQKQILFLTWIMLVVEFRECACCCELFSAWHEKILHRTLLKTWFMLNGTHIKICNWSLEVLATSYVGWKMMMYCNISVHYISLHYISVHYMTSSLNKRTFQMIILSHKNGEIFTCKKIVIEQYVSCAIKHITHLF